MIPTASTPSPPARYEPFEADARRIASEFPDGLVAYLQARLQALETETARSNQAVAKELHRLFAVVAAARCLDMPGGHRALRDALAALDAETAAALATPPLPSSASEPNPLPTAIMLRDALYECYALGGHLLPLDSRQHIKSLLTPSSEPDGSL